MGYLTDRVSRTRNFQDNYRMVGFHDLASGREHLDSLSEQPICRYVQLPEPKDGPECHQVPAAAGAADLLRSHLEGTPSDRGPHGTARRGAARGGRQRQPDLVRAPRHRKARHLGCHAEDP